MQETFYFNKYLFTINQYNYYCTQRQFLFIGLAK